jgi:hypothetical protein
VGPREGDIAAIAERTNELVGMVQLRQHPDGSRELGTLVVRRDSREQGIAAMLIDALLAKQNGRILMVTRAAHARHYVRWNFAPIARLAPISVRWNYWMGLYGGRIISLLQRRPFNRLAILDRPDFSSFRRVRNFTRRTMRGRRRKSWSSHRNVKDDNAQSRLVALSRVQRGEIRKALRVAGDQLGIENEVAGRQLEQRLSDGAEAAGQVLAGLRQHPTSSPCLCSWAR